MRRFFNLVAVTVFCFSLTAANYALAGHGHSGGQTKPAYKPANHSAINHMNQQLKNKVVTGTKNGVGYIADPAPRNLNLQGSNVTKITDPIRPKTGIPTFAGSGKMTTATTSQTNLLTITPGPTGVAPVVRDHTIPKPPATTNPYANPPVVTGDSGVSVDFFPFGFTAPYHRQQIVDHRTQPSYTGGGRTGGKRDGTFTPDTNGPANQR